MSDSTPAEHYRNSDGEDIVLNSPPEGDPARAKDTVYGKDDESDEGEAGTGADGGQDLPPSPDQQ